MAKKNHSKRFQLMLVIIIATIAVIALFFLFRKDAVADYFSYHQNTFEIVANDFCENQPDGFPIIIDKNDDIAKAVDYEIADDVIDAIQTIFSETDCDTIFASTTRQGTNFCKFSVRGTDKVRGIAFIDGNLSPTDTIFFGLIVDEYTALSDEWIYFEYYTAEGEKDIPG